MSDKPKIIYRNVRAANAKANAAPHVQPQPTPLDAGRIARAGSVERYEIARRNASIHPIVILIIAVIIVLIIAVITTPTKP